MDKTEELKEDIKKEISSLTEKLENKIDKTLAGIKYWGIGGIVFFCVIFSWLWDYKFDFTNEKHQQEISELRQATFTPSNEAIIREIRELKAELTSFHVTPAKRKKLTIKRKINNLPDSVHEINSEEK